MNEEIIAFIKLVVIAIQTNHASKSDATKALTDVLEKADKLHEELTGERIVKRGKNVLDTLVSQPLKKI